MEVFRSLIAVDVTNSPTMGEITREWIDQFVEQIFGAYDAETGIRHINTFFLLISKKNSKSTLAAFVMLTMLILNWRDEGEFLILAPTKEIADNSYKPMAAAIRASEELSSIFNISDHTRTIKHLTTNAELKVVAADSATVSGKKAIGVLVDELWQFGKNPRADAMLVEATGGLASRPEGFVIFLSTMSDEEPEGVFKQKLEYARQVRDGQIDDPQFLPLIYEFPQWMLDANLHLESENYYITNPNLRDNTKPELGGSVSTQYITQKLREARLIDQSALNQILAKHLNVQIGLNLRADRWSAAEYWTYCDKYECISPQTLIDHCEVICVGVDGGGLDDLLGVAAIGRTRNHVLIEVPELIDEDTKEIIPAHTMLAQEWLLWAHAWAHHSVWKRHKQIVSKLDTLMVEGHVTKVMHMGDDAEGFAYVCKRFENAGLLYKIGFDPAAIGSLDTALLSADIPTEKIVKVNQGYKLAASIRSAERRIVERVLSHDGNGLMTWCVGNARVVKKGNSIYITKQAASQSGKIDPLIGMFNAIELMNENPEAMSSSDHAGWLNEGDL